MYTLTKQRNTRTNLLLQRSFDLAESTEVCDDKHVVLVGVGGHGVQLGDFGTRSHTDGEHGDALVDRLSKYAK